MSIPVGVIDLWINLVYSTGVMIKTQLGIRQDEKLLNSWWSYATTRGFAFYVPEKARSPVVVIVDKYGNKWSWHLTKGTLVMGKNAAGVSESQGKFQEFCDVIDNLVSRVV